mgnify:CR=1 FL=1
MIGFIDKDHAATQRMKEGKDFFQICFGRADPTVAEVLEGYHGYARFTGEALVLVAPRVGQLPLALRGHERADEGPARHLEYGDELVAVVVGRERGPDVVEVELGPAPGKEGKPAGAEIVLFLRLGSFRKVTL